MAYSILNGDLFKNGKKGKEKKKGIKRIKCFFLYPLEKCIVAALLSALNPVLIYYNLSWNENPLECINCYIRYSYKNRTIKTMLKQIAQNVSESISDENWQFFHLQFPLQLDT